MPYRNGAAAVQSAVGGLHFYRTYWRKRKMARVYNFSAGPSMLPEAVLKTAQAELLDYHGSGMSVM